MPRQIITTPHAPTSPLYSQGVKAGPQVLVSGMVGIDPGTGGLAGPTILIPRSLNYSSTPPPEAIWPIRKMTNSAGFTGARPISTTSWPASMTSGGLVSSSHLT